MKNPIKLYRAQPLNYKDKLWEVRNPSEIQAQRWNSNGKQLIYTSDQLGTVFAEASMRVASLNILRTYRWGTIIVEEDQCVDLTDLPSGWQKDVLYTRALGDAFIKTKHLVLIVPSVVLPESRNFLINPHHPQYQTLQKTIDDGQLLIHPTMKG